MPLDSPVVPRRRFRCWPWIVLFLAVLPPVWHFVAFPDDVDLEFPRVARPTFNHRPPAAFRLAEPGDTIDRVAIYVSSLVILLAIGGLIGTSGDRGPWFASLAVGLAAFWYAATPGPTYDRWHGLGWRAVLDPTAPGWLRLALAVGVAGLAAVMVAGVGHRPSQWAERWRQARSRGIAALLVTAAVLVLARGLEIPRIEPLGYWPRWALDWALIALACALVRTIPRRPKAVDPGQRRGDSGVDGVSSSRPRMDAAPADAEPHAFRGLEVETPATQTGNPASVNRARRVWLGLSYGVGGFGLWYGLVVAGIWLSWYHRPLERLREVVPGRIFISAMPTARGLEIAQARHHFKTIVNLFPEQTAQRSPRLPAEMRFAETHGIRYVSSPSNVAQSDDFLDETLRLAQDPSCWPILIHCHGCMDRTPAWVGIYQFVVEGRPLEESLEFIEQHRGCRPKASVTLLYNRVLPRLAPERARQDPTVDLLRRCAEGTVDPYYEDLRIELARGAANPGVRSGVSGPVEASKPRPPSLTPLR